MSATRIWSKFKELLDVSWGTVSDGYLLKRSGTNIIGVPASSVGQVWRGEYDPATTYQPNDAVSYTGSSYLCGATTTGVAPVPSTASYLIPPLATTGSMGSISALPASNQGQYFARADNTWQLVKDISPTMISGQTAKTPLVAADQFLVWDSVSSQLRSVTAGAVYVPGDVVQTQTSILSVFTHNNSVVIPIDDTIPQITEGTLINAVTITPRFANSSIIVSASGMVSSSVANKNAVFAIFRDSVANAVGATFVGIINANFSYLWQLQLVDAPGTGAHTYNLRVGSQDTGHLVYINGTNSGRFLGGSIPQTLVAQEIKV